MSAPAAHSASLPIEFETVAALGIDVTLLLANLELTPAERLQRFQAMLSLHEQIQRRTLSEALLERRDHLDLAERSASGARSKFPFSGPARAEDGPVA